MKEKKLGKIIGALIKGLLKSFPLGNAAIKVVEIVKGNKIDTGESTPPINWPVIIVEVAGVLILGYLVIKGIIPVEQLIAFLQQFIP